MKNVALTPNTRINLSSIKEISNKIYIGKAAKLEDEVNKIDSWYIDEVKKLTKPYQTLLNEGGKDKYALSHLEGERNKARMLLNKLEKTYRAKINVVLDRERAQHLKEKRVDRRQMTAPDDTTVSKQLAELIQVIQYQNERTNWSEDLKNASVEDVAEMERIYGENPTFKKLFEEEYNRRNRDEKTSIKKIIHERNNDEYTGLLDEMETLLTALPFGTALHTKLVGEDLKQIENLV